MGRGGVSLLRFKGYWGEGRDPLEGPRELPQQLSCQRPWRLPWQPPLRLRCRPYPSRLCQPYRPHLLITSRHHCQHAGLRLQSPMFFQ